MKKERVTIKDIAAAAEVSPATVSLVLNHNPRIPASTVTRLTQIMNNLNYQPRKSSAEVSPNKKKIRKATAGALTNVALLIASDTALYSSPIYTRSILELQKQTQQHGLNLLLKQQSEDLQLSDMVDGAIIIGTVQFPDMDKQLQHIPSVRLLGDVKAGEIWDHVTYVTSMIGAYAGSYLYDQQCDRFFYIGKSCSPTDARWIDFERQLKQFNQSPSNLSEAGILLNKDDQLLANRQIITKKVDAMLDCPDCKTGIFCSDDIILPAICNELEKRNIDHLSARVAIVGANYSPQFAHGLIPRPALIDIKEKEIIKIGLQRLLERAGDMNRARQIVQLEPELIMPELTNN